MIVAISGPQGSGKTTLQRELVRKRSFHLVRPCTSRPMQQNEAGDGGYRFAGWEGFERLAAKGKAAAPFFMSETYYAFAHDELRSLDRFSRVVLVAKPYSCCRMKLPYPAMICIFLMPQDVSALIRWIGQRAAPEDMATVAAEKSDNLAYAPFFDLVVSRAPLDTTVAQVEAALGLVGLEHESEC